MVASNKNNAGGGVKASRKLDSFFGKGTRMTGTLKFKGNVRFDGVFRGKIVSKGKLLVGDTGDIDAEIEIGALLTSGNVRGNIEAVSRVQILPLGKIDGDVKAPVLQIDPGAVFNGKSEMPALLPETASAPAAPVLPGRDEGGDELMYEEIGEVAVPGAANPVTRNTPKRTIAGLALAALAVLLLVIWGGGSLIFTKNFFEKTEDMGLVVVNELFESNREKRLFEKGEDLKKKGDLKSAARVFKQLSDITSVSSNTRLTLARVFLELGDDEVALSEYERLLEMEPENINARREYLRALIKNSQDQRAVTQIREIIAVQPEDFSAQLELAALYRKMGRGDELYSQLSSMARQAPDHLETLIELAALQVARGNEEEGRNTYSKIVEFDPDQTDSNLAWALLNFRAGFEALSGVGFARHERLDPDHIEVSNNGGFRQLNMKKYDQALKTFKAVLRREPDNLRARFGVITVHAKMGHTSKAIALCENALETFPDVVPFQNRLAWLYGRKKIKLRSAIGLSGKAVRANPESPDYLDTLSFLHYLTGDRKRAVEYINRAIELSPGNRYYESQLSKFKSRSRAGR